MGAPRGSAPGTRRRFCRLPVASRGRRPRLWHVRARASPGRQSRDPRLTGTLAYFSTPRLLDCSTPDRRLHPVDRAQLVVGGDLDDRRGQDRDLFLAEILVDTLVGLIRDTAVGDVV